ncbi:PD-(D/E)XK nuclease family protein [Lacticaseibacillus sp. GG6-2]
MALQFILGTASADHRQAVIAQVQAALADLKAQVFYLVPNHVKFESEVSLMQGLRQTPHAAVAQNRVQVLSFSRLAWYFLKDSPLYAQPRLDTTSNTMLVARLLEENADQLQLFNGLVRAQGFVEKLAAQLAELLQGRIDAGILAQAVAGLPGSDRHRAKLADLVVMMHAYEAAIGPFATQPSLLAGLNRALTEADLSHTYFILNHFNDLAASEAQLVDMMMANAACVSVCLTLDTPPSGEVQGPDLFLPAKRLYARLAQRATSLKVPVLPPIQAAPRAISTAMAATEAFFVADTKMAPLADAKTWQTKLEADGGITLAKADSPYNELRRVAQLIDQGVHAGARYRDYLVIARHLDPYQDLIAPIFAEYDLPVFVDREQPMQHHPLVALMDSLFAINDHHYQYQDVMRLLRTELVVPDDIALDDWRHAVDLCDNHLLRTGVTGSAWLKDEDWQYFRRRQDETKPDAFDPDKTAAINTVRRFVKASLPPLYAALKAATTGQEAATALYQWLINHGVVAQLSAWRQNAIDRGDLAASQAGEQAWEAFVGILDNYVAILGNTPFDEGQFRDLIAAGFASATYTQIPSTLDQVVVSETALTRLPKAKHVFVIGATSLVMPDVPDDSALLSADDREQLQPYLPDTAWLPLNGPQSSLGDPFINYVAMLAGSQTLTISYPGFADQENHPSVYYTRLSQALGVKEITWGPAGLATAVKEVAGTPRSLLSDFVRVARLSRDHNVAIGHAWPAVLAAIKQRSAHLHDLAMHLDASLDYDNSVGKLDPDLAKKLYGEHLNVSISRLETYHRNPFEYFLKYGLNLQPRPEFALTSLDSGSFYHAVLDQALKAAINDPELPLVKRSDAQVAQLVSDTLAKVIGKGGWEILSSSNRMHYVTYRMQALLTTMVKAIRDQQKRTHFRPKRTEQPFGLGDPKIAMAPLVLPVANGRQISVRGIIDRLDMVSIDGQDYFMVIDYKSSKHEFKPQEAFYGVSMQMLTYIDAAKHDLPKQRPAGAVYMHMQKPAIDYKASYRKGQSEQTELFKQHRMLGLLVLPDDYSLALPLLTALDDQLPDGGIASPIVQLETLKNGGLYASRSKFVTPAQLDLYLAHNRREIVTAAEAIMAGDIELAPIQFKQEATTITNSDYQAIMLFDPATGKDRYHHVDPLDQATVLKKIEEEEDAGVHTEPTPGD